jgi:hypothetical protein
MSLDKYHRGERLWCAATYMEPALNGPCGSPCSSTGDGRIGTGPVARERGGVDSAVPRLSPLLLSGSPPIATVAVRCSRDEEQDYSEDQQDEADREAQEEHHDQADDD